MTVGFTAPRLLIGAARLSTLVVVLSVVALLGAMTMITSAADTSSPGGPATSEPLPVSMPAVPPLAEGADSDLEPLLDPPVTNPKVADRGGVYIETSQASREDLEALFEGLEEAIAGELIEQEPIVVVLHGDDASAFVRQNYASNKMLVDQAALLDSYGLIDVRMCTTWLRSNGFDTRDLPPYIDPVRYGRDEVNRLVAEGYSPYGSVDL